jgi:hypothetical protein
MGSTTDCGTHPFLVTATRISATGYRFFVAQCPTPASHACVSLQIYVFAFLKSSLSHSFRVFWTLSNHPTVLDPGNSSTPTPRCCISPRRRAPLRDRDRGRRTYQPFHPVWLQLLTLTTHYNARTYQLRTTITCSGNGQLPQTPCTSGRSCKWFIYKNCDASFNTDVRCAGGDVKCCS